MVSQLSLLEPLRPYMARLVTVLINKCTEFSPQFLFSGSRLLLHLFLNISSISLSHFCPISVLPVLSKVLERVLHNQIQSHLIKYDLLYPHQSGFHAGHSTQDVLLHITDKWLKVIDEGKYIILVLYFWTWLKPSIYTVDHSILCTKLTYGFQGSSYDLLCNYLAERQQRVSFHGDLSNWGAISIRVPQGSIKSYFTSDFFSLFT